MTTLIIFTTNSIKLCNNKLGTEANTENKYKRQTKNKQEPRANNARKVIK